ncbi:MAG: DUF2024 family protein [Bacteroidota bacterium]
MKIAVWDTYVKRENGSLMHFDILVPNDLTNEQDIYNYGNDYLKSKPFKTGILSSKECRFCHIGHGTETMINDIENRGYSIIEMENCS